MAFLSLSSSSEVKGQIKIFYKLFIFNLDRKLYFFKFNSIYATFNGQLRSKVEVPFSVHNYFTLCDPSELVTSGTSHM